MVDLDAALHLPTPVAKSPTPLTIRRDLKDETFPRMVPIDSRVILDSNAIQSMGMSVRAWLSLCNQGGVPLIEELAPHPPTFLVSFSISICDTGGFHSYGPLRKYIS